MRTSRRVALYARVSTDGQTTDNQLGALDAVAAARGWTIVATFVDEGVSGAKGRDGRPRFAALHRAVVRREIDLVMAWSVDRLGRSLQDLVGFLAELHAAGVDLYLHAQGLDTSTPAGRAMFGMLGVFAEFERALIQERVKAGLARARAAGTRLGRPPIAAELEAAIRDRLAAGGGIHTTARALGVGVGTVQRVRAGLPPPAAGGGDRLPGSESPGIAGHRPAAGGGDRLPGSESPGIAGHRPAAGA